MVKVHRIFENMMCRSNLEMSFNKESFLKTNPKKNVASWFGEITQKEDLTFVVCDPLNVSDLVTPV